MKDRDTSSAEEPTSPILESGRHPEHIGHYRILQVLGEGGMGIVYLAEQEQPLRRRVALKVIKIGMDTREVIARFESERQALALMTHPNIARVFDAGATEEGRPYFAMEYVPGIPINQYCDKQRLTTRERLELFIPLCQAVQHAHQKGVIHRDLKPSNVLVTMIDSMPVPKIIDFGVAKAISVRLTEKTVFTEQGRLIGTPEYMSPEQAEMTGLDIDTTTDVYSLGVILYELLAGALPFDPRTLRQAGLMEIHRVIRYVDPPKPSTRLSTLGDRGREIAERRRSEISSLRRQIKGELDWITMRAMEKDRRRRYPSASELAADIERHLKQQPVMAGPPHAAYQIRKFVLRHRAAAGLVAAGIAVLIGVTTMTILKNRVIARERDRANQEAASATEVADFLTGLFQTADPWKSVPDEITAREILDRGAQWVREESYRTPRIQVRLQTVIGSAYYHLGLYEPAQGLLEEALQICEREKDEPLMIESDVMSWLCGTCMMEGDLARARELCIRQLDIEKRILGFESGSTLANLADVRSAQGEAGEARTLLERAIERNEKTYGPVHAEVATPLCQLGMLLCNMGELENGKRCLERALNIGRQLNGADSLRLEDIERGLVQVLDDLGEPAEVLAMAERCLRRSEKQYGPDNIQVAASLKMLALVQSLRGDYASARRSLERAAEIVESNYGMDSPHNVLFELGRLSLVSGEPAEAVTTLERAARICERSFGPENPKTAEINIVLGRALLETGDFVGARRCLDQALLKNAGTGEPELLGVFYILRNQAVLEHRAGNDAAARGLFDRAMASGQKTFGSASIKMAYLYQDLADFLRDSGEYARADSLYQSAETIYEKYRIDHPQTAVCLHEHAALLQKMGNEASARELKARASRIGAAAAARNAAAT